MGKLPSFIVERDKEFFHWLSDRLDEKQVFDLYTVIPQVNGYGKQRRSFKDSLFELTDSRSVFALRKLIDEDKRFRFMHYGQTKRIMMLLERYCEFLGEKEKTAASAPAESKENALEETLQDKQVPEKRDPEIVDQDETVAVRPPEEDVTQSERVRKRGTVVIRTINGNEYDGDIPAEALASLCEALAAKYPDIIRNLISRKVLSAGSTSSERIELKNVHSYIDKAIKPDTAMRFAKWLSESCEEADLPESIFVVDQETESKAGSIPPAGEKDQSAVSSSRGWSKHEVALLIETYLKASENGYLKAAAEVLSHKLRDLARRSGKTIDASYRNMNGIVMQLGTVQYCFTDGKKGLSNASAQIREMVELYKHDPETFEKILQEAHQLVSEKDDEVTALLGLEEYGPLRDELVKQGITTIEQLKALDLWLFMNRHGLYSISKRQEIFSKVKLLLNDQADTDTEDAYCLRTKEGKQYYGKSPAAALVQYCEMLAKKYPLKLRALLGQAYNGAGMVVLYTRRPERGCIEMSNPTAYIDACLTDDLVLAYGIWLCQKCGDGDEPVEICAPESEQVDAVGEDEPDIIPEESTTERTDLNEEKIQGQAEEEIDSVAIVGAEVGNTGEDWLFETLSARDIRYDDKRKLNGCLWISGGHELDDFVDSCATKGYKFYFKADGYKAFGFGSAWWTKDIVTAIIEDDPVHQPTDTHQAETTDTSPVSDYLCKQAEQVVLETDLEGIRVETLAVILKTTVAATKRIVNRNNNIVDICEKLIHKDAFVDWDQAADRLESILAKLMDKNNGYVSRSQLYEYARADMQMFMNDNDMDNAQKIYDMAQHLFSKEKYHGVVYSFSNMQHISKAMSGLSSVLDVILNYAREQGGFFNEDDLFSYLDSVKIKTGNLRNGIMHVYDKPTFLFYAYHVFVLSECLGINAKWLKEVKDALDRLFADMGDHVVLRDIQPFWYAQLPSLPGDRPWTGILLQSILLHYGKKLGGAKTIYAYQSLSGDYLQSMLVSADSEVQTFNDAVIAVLVENRIEQREFDSEELRQILVERGLIGNVDLTGKLSKYIENDERFVWSNNGQRVSIRI